MSDSTLEPTPESLPTAGEGTARVATNGPTRLISRLDRTRDVSDTVVLEQLRLDPPQREESMGRISNYEILDIIGHGGMGIVLRAFDTTLHRIVAIKVISPSLITTEHSRERFLREARAAGGINHPNVVVIHGVNEHAGLPYLVMEYVHGQSLHDRIKSEQPFSEKLIVEISLQVAAGLSAAHRQQIIHRDIKPGNIMLEEDTGRAKITDFGLARAMFGDSELTTQGGIVGTPSFMSPEQVVGEPLDHRSDLFSLGCVIYAMFAGHSPFRSESPIASATKVHATPHQLLREACPQAPDYLAEIVEGLLKKDPRDRFQKADEIVAILTRQLLRLNQDDIEPTVNWSKAPVPKSSAGGWGVAAVCVLILVMWGAWFSWDRWQVQSGVPAKQVPAKQVPVAVFPPGLLTVAQAGQAQFTSLKDALKAAQPGDQIEVLDGGTYRGNLTIKSSEKFKDVTLKSTAGALLTSDDGSPLLKIDDVSNLRVSGFRFTTMPGQHGIDAGGKCPGLHISGCEFKPRDPDGENWAAIHLRRGASGTEQQPIVIRECRLSGASVGIVLGAEKDTQPIKSVVIESCFIGGAARSLGTSLVVQAPVQHITVADNIFCRGHKALAFVWPQAHLAQQVLITNNTVHDFDYFAYFENCDRHQETRIEGNLILQTDGIYTGAGFITEYAPWFANNWWETTSQSNVSLIKAVAEPKSELKLLSREPDQTNYLKPSPEAPADMPGRYSAKQGMWMRPQKSP